MLAIPKSEETLHKVVALVTSLVVFVVGVALLVDFDYDHTAVMQFAQDKSWIELINARYMVGIDGISLPLIALTMLVVPLVIIYSLGPLPRAAQPQGVPRPDPAARDGHDRHVRGPGPAPVLRLLRARPAPDVLHDRRVGRRAAQVRVAQVLPLHGVRLGADDRVDPGRVLPVAGERRRAAHLLDPGPLRLGRLGPGPRHRRAGLRRLLHGLRHQGADVPVPHLAARRPHPGPHAGLGHPGRRAPEARHLRLRPHRHPDPPGGRRDLGPRRSACSRSSASSTAPSAVWPRPT